MGGRVADVLAQVRLRGSRTLVWLLDVAGYDRVRAAETVRATARALLAAALRG